MTNLARYAPGARITVLLHYHRDRTTLSIEDRLPTVRTRLTGRKVLPERLPDYVGFGDESEAVDYAAGAAALWASVPGALAWLES